MSGIDCIYRQSGDPFSVLVSQSRLAYEPYEYVGYFHLDPERAGTSALGPEFWDDTIFWVHSWIDNYTEIAIEDSLDSPEELLEVVFDAGFQLGRGHTRGIAHPLDEQLRQAMTTIVDRRTEVLIELAEELTEETYRTWEQFRAETTR